MYFAQEAADCSGSDTDQPLVAVGESAIQKRWSFSYCRATADLKQSTGANWRSRSALTLAVWLWDLPPPLRPQW